MRLTKWVDGEVQENHDNDATPEQWSDRYKFRNGYNAILRKLAEYEDMEEQGQLVVLPCKVGDTVYRIDIDPLVTDKYVESCIVDNFMICNDGTILVRHDAYDSVICETYNITHRTPYLDYYLVFLTRAEAAALAAEGSNT